MLRAHPGALAAGAAGGRAGGGGDIPALFQKAAGAFRSGAAVVRFEQAGNVHPERTGHAVPAAVSYTHLDVYKRQVVALERRNGQRQRLHALVRHGDKGPQKVVPAGDERKDCLLYTSRCV